MLPVRDFYEIVVFWQSELVDDGEEERSRKKTKKKNIPHPFAEKCSISYITVYIWDKMHISIYIYIVYT